MSKTILVVDDETNIRTLCRLYFQREGFQVLEAEDGQTAINLARVNHPDLIVLDYMLPDISGIEVCRTLQEISLPIIMLTARSDEADRVLALGMGADDYVCKPFSPVELVARVRAVLRRTERSAHKDTPERLTFADFTIDLTAHLVTVRGKKIEMSPKEFDLLVTLASHPNRVFTREQLLEKVWDYNSFGDFRTVDVHIQRVRKKMEPDPEKPQYIKTIWGVGYRFESGEVGP